MIRLTPLEETVAGKELIQIGIKQGIEKGELIGKIQVMEIILKSRRSAKNRLLRSSIEELKDMLKKLERDFGH